MASKQVWGSRGLLAIFIAGLGGCVVPEPSAPMQPGVQMWPDPPARPARFASSEARGTMSRTAAEAPAPVSRPDEAPLDFDLRPAILPEAF